MWQTKCINKLYNHGFPFLGNGKRMPDTEHGYTGSRESVELFGKSPDLVGSHFTVLPRAASK